MRCIKAWKACCGGLDALGTLGDCQSAPKQKLSSQESSTDENLTGWIEQGCASTGVELRELLSQENMRLTKE